MEQRADDSIQETTRWLSHASEKLTWCGDTAGDKYCIDAKMATVKEIIDALEAGEQSKNAALQKIDLLLKVAPENKRAGLEERRRELVDQYNTLRETLQRTRFVYI